MVGMTGLTSLALRRFVRRSGFALTGILPSASPPCQTASSLVRDNAFGIFKNKKRLHKAAFFVFMVGMTGLELL